MSELSEVMEFLRDNVPTKSEMTEKFAGIDKQFAELRKEMNERFDDLEKKLDTRERLRLLEQRVAKLEDERTAKARVRFQH